MRRARRSARPPVDIWPGFVDAMSTLLLAVIFMLVVFVLAQFALTQLLQRRDQTVSNLQATVRDLEGRLDRERMAGTELRAGLGQLSADLSLALADRDALSGNLAETALQRADEAARTATERGRLTGQIRVLAGQLDRLSRALTQRQGELAAQNLTIADLGTRLTEALAAQAPDLTRARAALAEALASLPRVAAVGRGERIVLQAADLFVSGPGPPRLAPAGRDRLVAVAQATVEATAGLPPDLPWLVEIDVVAGPGGLGRDRERAAAQAAIVAALLTEAGLPAERSAPRGLLGGGGAVARLELRLATR